VQGSEEKRVYLEGLWALWVYLSLIKGLAYICTWQGILVHVAECLAQLQRVLEQQLVAEGLAHVLGEEAVPVHACITTPAQPPSASSELHPATRVFLIDKTLKEKS
jgi:hypothetical protein